MKIVFKILLYSCASLGLLVMPQLIVFLLSSSLPLTIGISELIIYALPALTLSFYMLDWYISGG